MTSVWPALWPPWNRTTTSACSESQSTILPLPSSPHWAPTTTTVAIAASYEKPRRKAGVGVSKNLAGSHGRSRRGGQGAHIARPASRQLAGPPLQELEPEARERDESRRQGHA